MDDPYVLVLLQKREKQRLIQDLQDQLDDQDMVERAHAKNDIFREMIQKYEMEIVQLNKWLVDFAPHDSDSASI